MIDSATEARPGASRIRAFASSPAAAPVLVGGMLVAAFVARALLARHVLAPWEMPDEMEYALTSRGFAATGHYLFREHILGLRTIYPAFISPAWHVGSTHTAYTLIKLINVVLMTLGGVPLYFWARRLVTPLWAVVAVALYLAIPGFVYTGEILTENAFVPATILAMFALAAALERPTLLRQLLALGAIVLVSAARLQGLVFFVVLPTAIVLVLVLDRVAAAPGRRRTVVVERLKAFWPSIGALALGLVAYGILALARGGATTSGLGTYQQLSSAHYSLRPALRWIAFHFGELSFSVGLLPVAALIVLFGLACRRATAPGPAERAFLAVTVASLFWVVVQVGAFASRFTFRVEERYMFNLAPALFLALVVWLDRGLPRPAGLTVAAVLAPAVALLVLPFETLFTQALFNDTYGLIPVWRLFQRLGNLEDTRLVLAAGALVAGLLFAAVPRRIALVVVPVALLAFLAVSTNSVFGTVEFLSSQTRHAGGLQGDPSWIDHAVGKDARVEILDTADIADPHVVWQAEFWNRSVRRVFGVTAQDPSIPDLTATTDAHGRIRAAGLAASSPDANPAYVVSAPSLAVNGTRIASAGQLVLWRVRQPLRLASLASGVTPDGWTGATASYLVYDVPRGATHVTVGLARTGLPGLPAARVQATVRPLQGPAWVHRIVTVPGGGSRILRLRLRPGPFRVDLAVSPTFSPSQYGSSDTRTLGVRASFSVG